MFNKFIISFDHRVGERFVKKIINYLTENGFEYEIVSDNNEANDYPILAYSAYQKFKKTKADGMILLCGTGVGMAMVANKFTGIRAVLATEESQAYFARRHEDSNTLVFGVGYDDGQFSLRLCSRKMIRILDIFVHTNFEAGRHLRRIGQIREIERNDKVN